jgi:hypothetical protein
MKVLISESFKKSYHASDTRAPNLLLSTTTRAD